MLEILGTVAQNQIVSKNKNKIKILFLFKISTVNSCKS